MANQHLYRVTVLAPAARADAVNAWVRSNLDPGSTWLFPNLSGKTYAWFSAAMTAPQAKLVLEMVASAAGVKDPGWDALTRDQREQWCRDNNASLKAGAGLWVDVSKNEGVWPSPDQILADAGVVR